MRFTALFAVATLAVACSSGAAVDSGQQAPLADDQLADGLVTQPQPHDGDDTMAGPATSASPSPSIVEADREVDVASPSDGSSAQGSDSTARPETTGTSAAGEATSGVDDREMGTGVTTEAILVGFHNLEIGGAATATGANIANTDEGAIADALVAWVNDTGGLAGRQMVAVHHLTEGSSGTWANQAQAACATFTEDNEVFAVIGSTVGGDDSLLACLAQRGTPLVDSGIFPYDQQYYDDYRGVLYKPGSMVGEQWVRAYADGLRDIGFFEDATVGLVTYDRPVTIRLSDNVLKPRLDAMGIAVEEQVVSPPGSVAGMGATGSQMASAILRFRAAGVDRILFLENGGTAPFLFFNEAESQGYRPRYGLSSNDVPNSQSGNAGPEQLTGAVAIGWTPPNDTYNHPGGNAAHSLCNEILEEAGAPTAGYYAQPRCDAVFMLRAALEGATALTASGLRGGVEALGSRYESTFTLGSSLGPGKHWGADLVQPLAYDVDCGCFNYTHSPEPAN